MNISILLQLKQDIELASFFKLGLIEKNDSRQYNAVLVGWHYKVSMYDCSDRIKKNN